MLQDLVWTPKTNPSGIGSMIFIAAAADVASIPAYGAAGVSTLAEGDIAMVATKTFRRIYSTQGKAKFGYESLGEKDAKLFKVMAELSYPDIDAKSKELVMEILNGNCVLLIPTLTTEKASPTYVMIGGHTYDTEVDAKGTSGDAPGSAKGLSLTVSSFDIVPGKTYEGAITLSDGSFDCATGVFTAGV